MRGQTDVINTLLINGADPDIPPNEDGFTPPTANASRQRREKVTTMLLERGGADPNKPNAEGVTPLMLAAKYGHEGIVNLMMQHNAEVNLRDNLGRSAMMYAAEHGYSRIVIALLSMGADKNSTDNLGNTAKDYATRFGHESTAIILDRN